MLRYIVRRVLYMIPTIFGVILITFVLFNIAGGDPAMLKLGKQATPKALEEYDLQRGYHKPLLCGSWGRTRAYPPTAFEANAGPWNQVDGAVYTRRPDPCLVLGPGRRYEIPGRAFPLRPSEPYRWTFVYRTPGAPASPPWTFLLRDGSNTIRKVSLAPARRWTRTSVEFTTPPATRDLTFAFDPANSPVELRSISLQRRVRHAFDSQLMFYLGQIARFDFGESAETNQKVSRMILDGIFPSLALMIPMFVLGLVTEIAVALLCAFYRNSWIDRFFVIVSVMLMSVSYLVWIVFGQYAFGYLLRWFPVWGFESGYYLVLPCLIGVFSGLGSGIRFYRTVMLDEMYRDYVRTALAKGVSRRGVLFRHVLKNAMIPILTSVVMAIPFLYTGSLLLESFFGIPGLGNLSINAINNSDVDVIRAVVLVGAVLYVIASLITDLCYSLVDPRVRLE